MSRLSLLTVFLLVACGPAEHATDAGSFPAFPTSSPGPGSSLPTGYGQRCSGDSECSGSIPCLEVMSASLCTLACETDATCPGSTRCLGVSSKSCLTTCGTNADCPAGLGCYTFASTARGCVPYSGGTGGGSGGGGGTTTPQINLAERVWLAQDEVFRTSSRLRASYGQNAIGWLRAARTAAGSQVTTGSLAERADGTFSWASGGSTLRVTTIDGRQFQLRVDALVGNVLGSSFPATDERMDVTWIFSPSLSSRCVLEARSAHFSGNFVLGDGEAIVADVTDSINSTAYSGDTGSGYATDVFGEGRFSGYVEFEDRRVDFTTSLVYSTCVGACGFSAAADYVYTHDVAAALDGATWRLRYDTGWKKQYSYSLPVYLWQGSISGPEQGSLVRRPVAASADALDVVIGADRYTTGGVVVVP